MSMSSITIGRRFAGLVASDSGRAVIEMRAERNQQVQIEEMRTRIKSEVEEEYRLRRAEQEKRVVGLCKAMEDGTAVFMKDFEEKVVGQMIEMSLRLAEIILRSQLPNRDMVEQIIKKTLSPVMDLQGVRIKLSSTDAELIKEGVGGELARILEQVEIAVDSNLKDGDVVVESRNGYFNSRIHERMSLLESELKERCGNVAA